MDKGFEIDRSWSAIRDLDSIYEYIASKDTVVAADRLHRKLMAGVETLKRYPRRGRVVPELRETGIREYRDLIVGPYRIFSPIRGKRIALLGVLDDRRDLEEVLIQRVFQEPL